MLFNTLLPSFIRFISVVNNFINISVFINIISVRVVAIKVDIIKVNLKVLITLVLLLAPVLNPIIGCIPCTSPDKGICMNKVSLYIIPYIDKAKLPPYLTKE